jgi:nitrate/nitrite transport system ATP-binding protein
MAMLEICGLSKSYGEGATRTEVLHEVNLSIETGEFVAIVGFSGSGKTTLISTIAGLLEPDAGEIRVRGERVTRAGPDRGVVCQSYSLMPWLTVEGNIALAACRGGPRARDESRDSPARRAIERARRAHARAAAR